MKYVLVTLLILYSVLSLAKFAVFFLTPYQGRIARVAASYENPRRIRVGDRISVALAVVLIVLLFLTDMQYLSFLTGLIAGMLLIQMFFHAFNRVLPDDKAPRPPAPPIKYMSYAIQARPARAWLEVSIMTLLFGWALYVLVADGLLG